MYIQYIYLYKNHRRWTAAPFAMGCCASTSADAGPGPARLSRLSVGSQSIEEENGDRRVSTAAENGGKPGEVWNFPKSDEGICKNLDFRNEN